MFGLLRSILSAVITPQQVVEIEPEPALEPVRTHEIMSGDTVVYWDDEMSSNEIGQFSHLYEWEFPLTESPYSNECSINGYEPVYRAVVIRWDGQVVFAVADSVELF